MAKENIQLQQKILMKLLKNKVLGSFHLRFETILSGVKRHEIGDLKQKDKFKEIREFLEVNQQCQNTN